MLRRSLCCSSHCAVAEHGSAACSDVRGAMKSNPETERELCHSPFQPNPGKKIVSYPSHPIDCSCSVFSLISVIITHTGVVEFTAAWAVAVSHEAAGRQCCQHPSVFLFPGCSFPILDAQTLPVAPCFAVSVVCIALRFRCGTVVLSHTWN